MIWTIIGTIATIIGTYIGYKQYQHSIRPSSRQTLDKNTYSIKNIIKKPPIKKELTQTNNTADIDFGNSSRIFQSMMSIISRFDSEGYKFNTLKALLEKHKIQFSSDEICDFIKLFDSEGYRYNALCDLISRIQKPISDSEFHKIISFFKSDGYKANATSILLQVS